MVKLSGRTDAGNIVGDCQSERWYRAANDVQPDALSGNEANSIDPGRNDD